MSIAITDDHRALAETVADFLVKHKARGAARALLDADTEALPAFWPDAAELGWLGLHLPEAHGGSGFGLPELVVVVEQLGRAVAPGPFVPTVIASAVIAAAGPAALQERLLPGLADGSTVGAVALDGDVEVRDGRVSGSAGVVVSGALANVLLVPAGDDVAVVDCASGVSTETPRNLDPTRRACARDARRCGGRGHPGRTATARRLARDCCSRRRRSASRASAPRWRPSTPRCASSSAGRSRCTRR